MKVVGTLALIDEGETDWKLVGIDVSDPAAAEINSTEDVEKHFPGLLRVRSFYLFIYLFVFTFILPLCPPFPVLLLKGFLFSQVPGSNSQYGAKRKRTEWTLLEGF